MRPVRSFMLRSDWYSGAPTVFPGTCDCYARPMVGGPPKPRLRILDPTSSILKTVLSAYPLQTLTIPSQFRLCPDNAPDPTYYAYDLAMMSLTLVLQKKTTEFPRQKKALQEKSAIYLLESESVLDDARPKDHLLACITYVRLVPP